MIIVAGEALIDLAPEGQALAPLRGGAPYNVAVGLGRLGRPTSYLGALSDDPFGRRLREGLTEASVGLPLAVSTVAPTTLAVVHLAADGRAEYGFYLEGTSAHALTEAALPELPDGAALHVSLGAVTLGTGPAGRALQWLLAQARGRGLVSLDPNVRPAVLGTDLAAYATRVEAAVADCDLVKVSDEDLVLLRPEADASETAARWARLGPALVVVTRGHEGAVAFHSRGRLEVPGQAVEVVDTVGAGDAFTSGLLAWLDEHGRLDRAGLEELGGDDLRTALDRAVHVAAITCTRAGANPPRLDEL